MLLLFGWLGRRLFSSPASRHIPPPSSTVQDVASFLGRIRHGCEQHAPKFPTWEALFTMRSEAMEEAGIPCRQRKLILRWVNKFRQGIEPYYIPPSIKLREKAKAKRRAAQAAPKR